MRALVFVAIVAAAAPAVAQPRRPDVDRTLSARDLTTYVEPYVPAIKACYLTHATGKKPTGALRLELVIAPDGNVQKLVVVAPGVRGGKLAACVREASAAWHFPVRRGFTSGVIPFYFQRTPGKVGPWPGCPSSRGCRGRRSTP